MQHKHAGQLLNVFQPKEIQSVLALLSDTYPEQRLRKDELWRLTIGYNKSYKGWRMVSAIVPKTPRKQTFN